jgi:hypothetical protein
LSAFGSGGPDGVESDVDAIVDSGFTASLTLPLTGCLP